MKMMMPPLPPRMRTCLRTRSLGRVILFFLARSLFFDVCCICVVFLSGDMPKPNFARTCHGLDSDVLLTVNHFAAFRTERTEAWHGCSWDASTLASGM